MTDSIHVLHFQKLCYNRLHIRERGGLPVLGALCPLGGGCDRKRRCLTDGSGVAGFSADSGPHPPKRLHPLEAAFLRSVSLATAMAARCASEAPKVRGLPWLEDVRGISTRDPWEEAGLRFV